jgi:hypothetical protein
MNISSNILKNFILTQQKIDKNQKSWATKVNSEQII